jgi:signal peptidase I
MMTTRRRKIMLATVGAGLALALVAVGLAAALDMELHQGRTAAMGSSPRIGEQAVLQSVTDPEAIRRGDVIVFDATAWRTDAPIDSFKGRVVGVPGDEVACCGGGAVAVNGTPVDEPYVVGVTEPFDTVRVPEGAFFVLGDARDVAIDSRDQAGPLDGAVPGELVQGRLVDVVWPPWRVRAIAHGSELAAVDPPGGTAPSALHRVALVIGVLGAVVTLVGGGRLAADIRTARAQRAEAFV